MRADRLVATLLLLQSRTKITASELAEELEVSVRTARRDLEALAMSGVPIYPQPGRGGGWSLVGGARTDLTGLNSSEAQALFVATSTSATTSPALKSAINKLTQALPETFRDQATVAAESVIVDQRRWGGTYQVDQGPFFEVLQQAIVERRQVRLVYKSPRKGKSTRIVHPLGLVTKSGVWYLVAGTDSAGTDSAGIDAGGDQESSQRTFRLSRVIDAALLADKAIRPDNFNLEQTWQTTTERVERKLMTTIATGFANPQALRSLRYAFGGCLAVGEIQPDGRYDVTLSSMTTPELVGKLAGFGSAVEISGPAGIRERLAEVARELARMYNSAP